MTAVATPPAPASAPAPVPTAATTSRRPGRWTQVGIVVVAWIVLYVILKGHNTLGLASADQSWVATKLSDFNNWVSNNQNSNPLFIYGFNEIRNFINTLTTFIQHLISQPYGSRPLPAIGWLGVVALAGYAAWALGNWKVSLLTIGGLVFMGLQGLWQQSMDTLSLTIVAVGFALIIGIPLGVWCGVSDRFSAVITPVLDVMQILPTYTYLAPLALFFGIGPATGVIATLIYAAPPVIRLTSHGIREVPAGAIEASESLGSTRSQHLRKVLVPMARRTIVLGINQTMMAALAMVTIAALVGAPGLGQVVLQALESQDVGTAANGGIAIVVLAIILDRVITAASVHSESLRRTGGDKLGARRRPLVIGGGVLALVLVYVSYTYLWAAQFPGSTQTSPPVGNAIISAGTNATNWVANHLSGLTNGIKNNVTNHGLNHLQNLFDTSPFYVTFAALVLISLFLGGKVAAAWTAGCLALIIAIGLWQDSMDTLTATLVGTVIVMILGVVVGVWMGRSARADQIVRPVLDALQVMPPFVYLVPFLAFFGPTRFTGIVAGILYAAPVSIKIIADGIRSVSPTTVEAAESAGSSTWQVITKVQLPMSMRTLVLATNQGLIYVLSMVVVSGLVGGGALGFDVVQGFTQNALYGKGLAAGVAIVLLGIMLDRTTRRAAERSSSRRARA